MQHINRLLIKARKVSHGSGYRFAICFVEYDEERNVYTTKLQLWDGKPGTATELTDFPAWWRDEWSTEGEALEAVQKLLDSYGIPPENSVIFSTDYGLED